MRHKIRQFIESVFEVIEPNDPIVEIGSYQVKEQGALADLRPLFPKYTFIGCDMREGLGVDKIENVESLSFDDGSIGTILMMDVLEHVSDPFRAMQEVHRVLKPGGLVLMSSVMDFPIHAHPDDYWRYTPSAFRLLTKRFASNLIWAEGFARQPETVIALCSKVPLADHVADKITARFQRKQRHPMPWYKSLAVNLLWGYRRFRDRNSIILVQQ